MDPPKQVCGRGLSSVVDQIVVRYWYKANDQSFNGSVVLRGTERYVSVFQERQKWVTYVGEYSGLLGEYCGLVAEYDGPDAGLFGDAL